MPKSKAKPQATADVSYVPKIPDLWFALFHKFWTINIPSDGMHKGRFVRLYHLGGGVPTLT